MRNLMLGMIQMESSFLDVQKNLEKAERLVRQACSGGAQLVCLPEMFNLGFFVQAFEKMLPHGEDRQGRTITHFSRLARELEIWMIVPILEKLPGGKYANTPFVLNSQGEIAARYPKSHILRTEEPYFQRGHNYQPIDTPFGRIGVITCNDLCFPEVARMFAINGTELLLVPSAWQGVSYMQDWWNRCLAARALDNQFFVAAANQCGPSSHGFYAGTSKVLNPRGDTLIKAGLGEEVLLCQVDLDSIEAEREYNTSFADRRPEEYGLIAEIR